MKTLQVDDTIHKLIVDKQREIHEKKGYYPQIRDIVEKLISENIDKIEG